MSYVDAAAEIMNRQLDGSERALDLLAEHGPAVIRQLLNVHYATILLPPWVKNEIADMLIERMMNMISYARKAIAFHRIMVRALGSPEGLRAAAEAIGSLVSKASGDLALDVREENLDGMNPANWGGDGQYGYSQAFDGQRDAVTRIGSFSSALEGALGSMADTIESYYIELAVVVLGLVGAIAGVVLAILTAIGIVTIPIAVLSVVGAILSFLIAVGGLIAMIVTLTQNTENAIKPLAQDLEAWPSTAFSV